MPRPTAHIHDRLTEAPGVDPVLARKILAAHPAETVKENRRGRVDRVEVDGESFARKHYPSRGARRWLPFIPASSRARRSWRAAEIATRLPLPLPEPICLLEDKNEAVMVTRWFDGEPLHIWHARHLAEGTLDPGSEKALFEWLGKSIAEIFSGGFRSSDMAPQNLVLAGDPQGPWSLALVDLDDAIIDRNPTPREIEVSLAQLAHLPPTVSSTCLMRALDSFLEAGGSGLISKSTRKLNTRDFERRIAGQVLRLKQAKDIRMRVKEEDPHRFSGWGLDRRGFPN